MYVNLNDLSQRAARKDKLNFENSDIKSTVGWGFINSKIRFLKNL